MVTESLMRTKEFAQKGNSFEIEKLRKWDNEKLRIGKSNHNF
jgi:hypothetical protein